MGRYSFDVGRSHPFLHTGLPRRFGLVVAAQVRNGRAWATVRLVRTQPSGRFVARYRFKYGNRRYQVRALVPAQPAWPLYSGHSQHKRVRTR